MCVGEMLAACGVALGAPLEGDDAAAAPAAAPALVANAFPPSESEAA